MTLIEYIGYTILSIYIVGFLISISVSAVYILASGANRPRYWLVMSALSLIWFIILGYFLFALIKILTRLIGIEINNGRHKGTTSHRQSGFGTKEV